MNFDSANLNVIMTSILYSENVICWLTYISIPPSWWHFLSLRTLVLLSMFSSESALVDSQVSLRQSTSGALSPGRKQRRSSILRCESLPRSTLPSRLWILRWATGMADFFTPRRNPTFLAPWWRETAAHCLGRH